MARKDYPTITITRTQYPQSTLDDGIPNHWEIEVENWRPHLTRHSEIEDVIGWIRVIMRGILDERALPREDRG